MIMGNTLAFLGAYLLLPAAIAYFCGCFNGSVIVSKYILRDDIREHGSGNAGLTNFYRTFGGLLTFAVIACDVLKMIAAVSAARVLMGAAAGGWASMGVGMAGGRIFPAYWAGLFCMLGHMFPVMFHFKGGKGILSGGTLAIMIDWRVALVVWGGWFILVALTRYVSLGSVWAGASFPFASWACFASSPLIIVLSFITGGLVVWQHRANIGRLIRGNESKFHFHRQAAPPSGGNQ